MRFLVTLSIRFLTISHRQIILALLDTGEVYLVDLRKEHRGRFELMEALEEDDDESQMARGRLADMLLWQAKLDF